MGILVVDQTPDLFWYVSGALREDEIPLRHLPSITVAEQAILQDVPEIVVVSGDEGLEKVVTFITKIRNNVFARNILFIVFNTSSDPVEKRKYLVAGAGFVLFRSMGQVTDPKFFRTLVQWFLNIKAPEQQLFEHKPALVKMEGELTTYGRIGWISPTHVMLETNLSLEPGESIDVTGPLFEELGIKEARVQCMEKNKVGRYYQYANSLMCTLVGKYADRDERTLKSWIKQNQKMTKSKAVKIVFFEPDFEYRKTIRQMIKADSRFCARGYHTIDDMLEVLEYQKPQLVIINRALIQKDKAKFEVIKKFMANNFCYCVTYSNDPNFDAEEFKKQFEYAMHSKTPLTVEILEAMINKLQAKMPNTLPVEESQLIYFNKNSVYSRITFQTPCLITEFADVACGVYVPYTLSNFCGVEIAAHPFVVAKLPRTQFFRVMFIKPSPDKSRGMYHRMMLVGTNFKERDSFIEAMNSIVKFSYDRWLIGDVIEEKKK